MRARSFSKLRRRSETLKFPVELLIRIFGEQWNNKSAKRGASVRRSVLVSAGTVILFLSAMGGGPVMAQPFKPIRELSSWYTDQSLVDIEIIGSTSLLADSRRLEPDRFLRFRLERAYVQNLTTQSTPGNELVSLAFDSETGKASSLFSASSMRGRFHEEIPGVPALPRPEVLQRSVLLSLRSDLSRASVEALSQSTRQCIGSSLDDGLITYEPTRNPSCFVPSYRRSRQYAARYGDLLLRIVCKNENPRRLGCKTQFPFESFAVEMTFHVGKLPKWRSLIEQASAFLKSKQQL